MTLALYGKSRKRRGTLVLAALLAVFIAIGAGVASRPFGEASAANQTFNATAVEGGNCTNRDNALPANSGYTWCWDGETAVYRGFGISLPAGATLTGLEVLFTTSVSDNGQTDKVDVRLQTNSAQFQTKSVNVDDEAGTGDPPTQAASAGGSADKWNHATWTSSDLTNLQVYLKADSQGALNVTKLDNVRVVVHYTEQVQQQQVEGPVSGGGITPVGLDSPANPVCSDLDVTYGGGQTWLDNAKIDGQPTNQAYDLGGGRIVTIANAGAVGGQFKFDWSSNFGVDAVLVKQGSDAHNLYVYAPTANSPESTGDTGLGPQMGLNNSGGVSHVSFCYDTADPAPQTRTVYIGKVTYPPSVTHAGGAFGGLIDAATGTDQNWSATLPANPAPGPHYSPITGYTIAQNVVHTITETTMPAGWTKAGDPPYNGVTYWLKSVTGTPASDACSAPWDGGFSNSNIIPSNATSYLVCVKNYPPAPKPDLTISKSGPASVIQGGQVSYTLTVTNTGAAQHTGDITVTDTLPAGFTNIQASGAPGSGWNCQVNALVVTCVRASNLAAGASAPAITITATAPGGSVDACHTVNNVASVAGFNEVTTTNNTSNEVETTITDCVGSIEVSKVVNWNGVPNYASSFEICIEGVSPTVFAKNCQTLSGSGTVSWGNLAPGTYSVTETNPGSQWNVTGGGNVTVNVGQKSTSTVTNTHKLADLDVTKIVNWSGATPDSSQTFQICIKGPSYPLGTENGACKDADFDGGVLSWINIIPGNYEVKESPLSPAAAWSVTGNNATVNAPAGGDGSATITNTYQLGSIEVTKTIDWNGATPDSTTFSLCITGPSPATTKDCKTVSEANKVATWSNLLPGSYTFTEEGVNTTEWTIVSGNNANLTVTAGQKTTHAVSNELNLGALQVTKSVDWQDVSQSQQWSDTFQICITGPSYPQPDCQDFVDGETLSWDNLIPGDYTVTETSDSDYDTSINPTTVTVTAGEAASANAVTVTNTIRLGSLTVTKDVEWLGPMDEGQTFTICIKGPSYPNGDEAGACHEFDAPGGQWTWNELLPGTYTVTEVGVDTTEWIVSGEGDVSVSSSPTAPNSATVTNTQKPGIIIIHKDYSGEEGVTTADRPVMTINGVTINPDNNSLILWEETEVDPDTNQAILEDVPEGWVFDYAIIGAGCVTEQQQVQTDSFLLTVLALIDGTVTYDEELNVEVPAGGECHVQFVNRPATGDIAVAKVIVNEDNSDTFSGTLTGPQNDTFSGLMEGSQNTIWFYDVPLGAYEIAEDSDPDYTLLGYKLGSVDGDLYCPDPEDGPYLTKGEVELLADGDQAGICIYNERGNVLVDEQLFVKKIVIGGQDAPAPFTGDVQGLSQSDWALNHNDVAFYPGLTPGSFTVVEDNPGPSYSLVGYRVVTLANQNSPLNCPDPDAPGFNTSPTGAVTLGIDEIKLVCVYNEPVGRLIIKKVNIGGEASHVFTADINGGQQNIPFSQANPSSYIYLPDGMIQVKEDTQAGYEYLGYGLYVHDTTCPSTPNTPGVATAPVMIDSPYTKTLCFYNRRITETPTPTPTNTPTQTPTPSPTPQTPTPTPTNTPTQTPTPETPTPTPTTPIDTTAGVKTPGPAQTPIAPSTGTGILGTSGTTTSLLMALIGLLAMTGGLGVLALGRNRNR